MLNLLNTAALVEQLSYWGGHCLTATCGCDGDYINISSQNPPTDFNWLGNKVICSLVPGTASYPEWWKVTFAVATTIKTTLFINRDDACQWRLTQ